jgi:hypothetical protein
MGTSISEIDSMSPTWVGRGWEGQMDYSLRHQADTNQDFFDIMIEENVIFGSAQ